MTSSDLAYAFAFSNSCLTVFGGLHPNFLMSSSLRTPLVKAAIILSLVMSEILLRFSGKHQMINFKDSTGL